MKNESVKMVVEEYNLFNPAFSGIVISKAVENYTKIIPLGLSFPLVFLILPVVLHEQTRRTLPRSVATSLVSWINSNPAVRLGLAERIRLLRKITKESVLFSTSNSFLSFSDQGNLIPTVNFLKRNRQISKLEGDAKDCVVAAGLLGRWFGVSGSVETILTVWGVKP